MLQQATDRRSSQIPENLYDTGGLKFQHPHPDCQECLVLDHFRIFGIGLEQASN